MKLRKIPYYCHAHGKNSLEPVLRRPEGSHLKPVQCDYRRSNVITAFALTMPPDGEKKIGHNTESDTGVHHLGYKVLIYRYIINVLNWIQFLKSIVTNQIATY